MDRLEGCCREFSSQHWAVAVSIRDVSPATANVNESGTQQFTAIDVFTDQSTLDVTSSATWANTAGSGGCTGSTVVAGLFHRRHQSTGTCLPQATSGGQSGTATLTVVSPANPINIQTTSLPNAQIYQPYSQQLVATCRCTPPYTVTKTPGTLPTGMSRRIRWHGDWHGNHGRSGIKHVALTIADGPRTRTTL